MSRIFKTAFALNADVYHLHDPEFLRSAVSFQEKCGRPVIYDAHEDVRMQIYGKNWLPSITRPILSRMYGVLENRTCRKLAGIVAATPAIAKRFENHPFCIIVQNFPFPDEFAQGEVAVLPRPGRFVYVGGISRTRGIYEMIEAISRCGPGATLALAGKWTDEDLHHSCQTHPGWKQVDDLGFLGRSAIFNLLHSAQAGMVLLHPTRNYVTSYPIKLFEYMAARLPVIASNFPLWQNIIEEAGCGFLVNPLRPEEIATAMLCCMKDLDHSSKMGLRGYELILSRYNWNLEFTKLQELYRQVTR